MLLMSEARELTMKRIPSEVVSLIESRIIKAAREGLFETEIPLGEIGGRDLIEAVILKIRGNGYEVDRIQKDIEGEDVVLSITWHDF